MLRRNLLCFSLFLLPLILDAAGQSLASSMHPPFRYFYRSIIFPLSLVFSRLNNSTVSASPLRRDAPVPTHLHSPLLGSLYYVHVHLQCGAQNWMQYSRCGSLTANRGSCHLPKSLPCDNAVKITGA